MKTDFLQNWMAAIAQEDRERSVNPGLSKTPGEAIL
jgi:hypothetical protein